MPHPDRPDHPDPAPRDDQPSRHRAGRRGTGRSPHRAVRAAAPNEGGPSGRGRRPRLRRRAGWHRLTTLWPFAEPGSGAGWLDRTLATLVARYSRSGARILLIAPPRLAGTPTTRAGRDPNPYAGLVESVWTLARRSRHVHAITAAPAPDDPTPTGDTGRSGCDRSGSRPRPTPTEPAGRTGPDHDPTGPADRGAGSARRHDLIITAVHPHDTDWVAHVDWIAALTPTGTLAVITHSDTSDGSLTDPTTRIVTTLREHSAVWWDHIAVLERPLPDPARPGGSDRHLPRHRRHHDVLLFTAQTGEHTHD